MKEKRIKNILLQKTFFLLKICINACFQVYFPSRTCNWQTKSTPFTRLYLIKTNQITLLTEVEYFITDGKLKIH